MLISIFKTICLHCSVNSLIITTIAVTWLLSPSYAVSQTLEYWQNLLHRERLADTLNVSTSLHASSYARNGGNNDGGGSIGVDTDGCKILCDFAGPGVISHLWTTYRPMGTKRLKIYVDNMAVPIIDTTITALFGGGIAPFTSPLVQIINASHFSDVPIPFNSRIKITTNTSNLYFDVLGQRFPADSTIESFTLNPSVEYLARLDSLAILFNDPEIPALSGLPSNVQIGESTIAPGQHSDVLTAETTGTCRRLMLLLDSHLQSVQEKVWIEVYVDNYPLPVMYGPVSSLFGAGLGWRPYQSLVTGMAGDSLYINLPLPFRSSLRVNVTNNTPQTRLATVKMEIVEQPAFDIEPLRLSALYEESLPTHPWNPYQICDVSGEGNLIGMFWEMQSTSNTALEGDVRIYVDNSETPLYNGTGTEDFFDGSYYWTNEQGEVVPFQSPQSGMLRLSGGSCAAYRWLLTNPIVFHDRVKMTIEVGCYGDLQGYYRTTAWMYRRIPRWVVIDASGDGMSSPGETIRLVGYGLTPGEVLTEVRLNEIVMNGMVGEATVNSDSIIDISITAPENGTGTNTLLAVLGGNIDTVQTDWIHQSSPHLVFTLPRNDPDSLSFAGDTLNVLLHGLQPGASAVILADDIVLPWIGTDTLSNASGVLDGQVILPAGYDDADMTVKAVSAGEPDAIANDLLHYRSFYRMEFETLPILSWQGLTKVNRWGPDYTSPSSIYPWGRDLLHFLDSNQQGDSVRFSFSIRDSGVYRVSYFLAFGGGTSIVEAFIDGDSDMQYDTYNPGLSWRIARTDTILGSVRILSAGPHTLTMKAAAKNPSSSGYDIWMDQLIIQEWQNYPPEFNWISPAQVDTVLGAYMLYWDDFDPDDNAEINLYAAQGSDTFEISESPIWEDDENEYQWNVLGVEAGWYHLFAVIDDGISAVTSAPACSLYVSSIVLNSVEALTISIVPESGKDISLSWTDTDASYYYVFRSTSLDSVQQFLKPFVITTSNQYLLVDELISDDERMFYSVAALQIGLPAKSRKSCVEPNIGRDLSKSTPQPKSIKEPRTH